MILSQIFDSLNIGIIILDRDLKVEKWNRWMEAHSGIEEKQIAGTSIFEAFPDLNTPKFNRSCKSVLSFGNFCFFSQKLHKYMFPFKSKGYFETNFDFMQQSCAMGPLRDENNEVKFIFIYVHDVTEVASYEKKLKEMTMKDGLTGVYNRRYLETRMKEEYERHVRYDSPLSLVMLDIDHFKNVNDTYGHQCGDYILKAVADGVGKSIRNVDCLARYGGEEFCCLLPETGIEAATMVAERFRKVIMDQEHTYDGNVIKVTISLGVAEVVEGINSAKILQKEADALLYQAKRQGRNKVVAMNQG
ncbi:MAG: diguanylate cyclase [Nitrospira bacterium SG8_35_1]|nr:MAG: diguanylate cyclase [Nitrospira bacterium SG8_35_1]